MKNTLTISPEELYYLGTILQAKSIDYAYLAAMEDIGQNFAMFESKVKTSLSDAGLLTEDFSGNVEVNDFALKLLKPIYFGEAETSLDICTIGNNSSVKVIKFHFLDGIISMVTGKNGSLVIKQVDLLFIKDIVEKLLPENYSCENSNRYDTLEKDKVTRFVAVKSVLFGKSSVVKTYIEADNVFFRETDEEAIESVTKEMFISDVFNTVKGA